MLIRLRVCELQLRRRMRDFSTTRIDETSEDVKYSRLDRADNAKSRSPNLAL